jgi:hypothetical protein
MKTALFTIACLLGAAAVPALAQDADDGDAAFEDAFGTGDEADTAAEPEFHDETIGEWRVYDGQTDRGERRVFMHKDLGPDRYLEFDLQEGGGAAVTFGDPNCGFGSSFDVQELGEARAAGLADKFADMLDDDSCDARSAVPTVEELVEPLAKLDEWVAARPFPAAGYWKPEDRVLSLGHGDGHGVGRYEGRVSIVYLEPEEGARGPAEVIVNIYECPGFDGRTLPVRSDDPAEAQDIARTVLEERAEACGLDPETPARLADGLPEGLAAQKAYAAQLASDDQGYSADDYDPGVEPSDDPTLESPSDYSEAY